MKEWLFTLINFLAFLILAVLYFITDNSIFLLIGTSWGIGLNLGALIKYLPKI